MALCEKCKGPVSKRASSRDARHALYKALIALGAEMCPECKDYVILPHDCAAYQAFRDYGLDSIKQETEAIPA